MGVLGKAILAVALLALSCSGGSRYEARGVVEDVAAEHGQVVIAHEDIPGLMPAMTMNFDVPDPELLAELRPGQVVDFVLDVRDRRYRVVAVTVREEIEPGEGWARLGDDWVRADRAPDFALVDQDGQPLALGDLAGHPVLLDFIFTSCPGPCPILTGLHRDAREAIDPELRDRVRFVSITLDPERDDPDAMSAYARRHGVDPTGWSFLTGPPDEVASVVKAYGVGSTRKPGGDIDHLIASFLIDDEGRVVKRYLGLEHTPEAIARDLEKLASR